MNVNVGHVGEGENAIVEGEGHQLTLQPCHYRHADKQGKRRILQQERVPQVEYFLDWEYMGEHGQKPWNGVQVGDKCLTLHIGQMIGQFRIVKSGQLLEDGQVLLDDFGVVAHEQSAHVLVNELAHSRPGQVFSSIVDVQKRRGQTVQPLPVRQLGIPNQPGLNDTLDPMGALGTGNERLVLVTARNIDINLTIGLASSILVNRRIQTPCIGPHVQQRTPNRAAVSGTQVDCCLGNDQLSCEGIATQETVINDLSMKLDVVLLIFPVIKLVKPDKERYFRELSLVIAWFH